MRKINEILLSISKGALMIMVPVMTVIIFMQVVLRYVFLSPLRWPEELGRYLLVWISLLGSVYALRVGLHVSIAFLKEKFPRALYRVTTVVVHVSLLTFFVFCTVQGYIYAISQWHRTTPAMEIPATFPIMAVPVGCGIMFFINLEIFIDDLREFRSGEYTPRKQAIQL